MTWLDDLVTSYRDHGLTVVEPTSYDWRSFGTADWTQGRPVGTTKHHFVISYDVPDSTSLSMLTNGYQTDHGFLPGPVANTELGQTGTVYVIAGRVANHGGSGIKEVIDRCVADLPCRGDAWRDDDWGFNGEISRAMWGTECHHPGTAVPMPDEQLAGLIRMSAAECEAMGWSANRVLMHLEQTTRKQDINRAVITGADLRSRVADTMTHRDEFERATTDQVNGAVLAGFVA